MVGERIRSEMSDQSWSTISKGIVRLTMPLPCGRRRSSASRRRRNGRSFSKQDHMELCLLPVYFLYENVLGTDWARQWCSLLSNIPIGACYFDLSISKSGHLRHGRIVKTRTDGHSAYVHLTTITESTELSHPLPTSIILWGTYMSHINTQPTCELWVEFTGYFPTIVNNWIQNFDKYSTERKNVDGQFPDIQRCRTQKGEREQSPKAAGAVTPSFAFINIAPSLTLLLVLRPAVRRPCPQDLRF